MKRRRHYTKRRWRCPACKRIEPTAAALSEHLSAHMPPRTEEEAKTRWKCPVSTCKREKWALIGPFFLAGHIDHYHATSSADTSRQTRSHREECAVSRPLRKRPLAELLALDWTRTNAAIGERLGLSRSQAAYLRRWLRDQGHPIPQAKRGAPRKERHDEKYIAAGLGKRPDGEIAREFGVSDKVVYHMRRRLGIPPARKA